MNKLLLSVLTLMLMFIAPSVVFSHHGPGQFNGGDVEVTGKITKVRFVNPHGYIYFDVTGDDGKAVAWRCELQAGSLLKRAGWTPDLFPIGSEVVVKGSAGTKEYTACALDTVELPDGTVLDRYGQMRKDVDDVKVGTVAVVDRLVDGKLDLNGSWAAPQRALEAGGGMGMGMGGGMGMGPGGMGPRGALPEGLALTDAGKAAVEGRASTVNPRHECRAANIFFDWTFDRHVNEIVQTDYTIVMKYGLMDIERTIHLNMDQHPADIEPSVAGHSIGKLDGATLTVDTIGFAQGYLAGGIENSEQMKATETFTFDPKTQSLTRKYAAVDPLHFTGTYSGEDTVYPSNTPFEPYDCVELMDDFIQEK